MIYNGKFITFEGPEGSGKTTQIVQTAEFLRAKGYRVVTTREPGGTPIGDIIRDILMGLKYAEMRPRTEILLFQASRAQHVEQVILPSLEAGAVVLSDRYADSTLAYQGYGYKQFTLEELKPLVSFATGGLTPDLTLLLDIDVKSGLERRKLHGGWTRMDAYEIAFHQRVREGFLEMAKLSPERWAVVDARKPLEQVQREIQRLVIKLLESSENDAV